jgi:chromosome segregation ATPase
MLGGKVVENFMGKLAEKINAQDIIKANAQAEAAEAERIRQEAEQYRIQLQELKDNEKEHKAAIDETRAAIGDTRDVLQQTREALDETRQLMSKRMDENETRIHDVGVQVYRNVQAVVEKGQAKESEEFKELGQKLESIQVGVETKNNAVVPLVVITMIIALADLVINILRILGIV